MMTDQLETNVPNCYLRFAEKDDVPLILDFIQKLAEYERMLDEVVATESFLDEHLFGENPKAEVLLAYFENSPVGFALFFHNFSTFEGRPGIYLEDLFVEEEARGNGIGTALLSCLANLAVERNCARLEWAVLDWNTPSIEFYKSLDANCLEDWETFRLSGEYLMNLSNKFEHQNGH